MRTHSTSKLHIWAVHCVPSTKEVGGSICTEWPGQNKEAPESHTCRGSESHCKRETERKKEVRRRSMRAHRRGGCHTVLVKWLYTHTTHTGTLTCTQVCKHTITYACTHACTHEHIYTDTHTCKHTLCTCLHAHTRCTHS